MTTRTPTGRTIEVPDLVGFRADQAILRLREVGLMPITLAAEVEDVSEAGFVLGLDPAAGSPVRPKAFIAMRVAVRPDLQGRADDSLAGHVDKPVQPPSPGPEICDHVAISPGGCRDALAKLQEHGLPDKHSW